MMPDTRAFRRSSTTLLAALLLAAGCRGDATVPASTTDALVIGGIEHTLVGPGGRRGTLRADSGRLDEALGTLRLIRPRIDLVATPTRLAPVELGADSGTLDIETGVIRLFRPGTAIGVPTSLLGRDTVVYDAVGDTVGVPAAATSAPTGG